MILSVLFTTILGLGIGFLSLRLSGVYFSLLTLSFAAMTFYVIYRWTHFTGGEDGYGGMERPTLFGIDLNNQTAFLKFYKDCALSKILHPSIRTQNFDDPYDL